eukprot:s2922_g6.t1
MARINEQFTRLVAGLGATDSIHRGSFCFQWLPALGRFGMESCLTLDVYTPAVAKLPGSSGPSPLRLRSNASLPVMVFIEGGGFLVGDKYQQGIYDGRKLVDKQNVVLVNINYRLGVLGFLHHPYLRDKESGEHLMNFGLRDQLEALRWIQDAVLAFYGLPGPLWDAFCAAVGDPGEDLRVLASMPAMMLSEAVTAARMASGRRLTPVEAIQLGMVYRACHLLVHLATGGSQGTWQDPDPWGNATSPTSTSARDLTTSMGSSGASQERKMKLSQVADQGDESEFPIIRESAKAGYYTKYAAAVGGMPADSEDPTMEQISAVVRLRFCGVGSVCKETSESTEVSILCVAGGWLISGENGSRSCLFCSLASILPSTSHHPCHAGGDQPGESHGVGVHGGAVASSIPRMLGIDCSCRRSWTWRIYEQNFGKAQTRARSGRNTAPRLESRAAVERGVVQSLKRQRLLERPGAHPRNIVDRKRTTWEAIDSNRTNGRIHDERGPPGFAAGVGGERGRQRHPWKAQKPSTQGSSQEAPEGREGGASFFAEKFKRWRSKGFWQSRIQEWQHLYHRSVLRLEQRQRTLWRATSRRGLPVESGPTSSMFPMRESSSSIKILPKQEELSKFFILAGLLVNAGETEGQEGKAGSSSSTTDAATSKTLPGREVVREVRRVTKRKRFTGEDPPGDDEPPKDKIHVRGNFLSFKEYLEVRKFVFLHHFSGKTDNLSQAVSEECEKLGLKVDTTSVDLEKGQDLMREEPYRSHKQAAEDGVVDGYHAGFPCNTFSKLRWRAAPGLPGPLRSKSFPYGFRDLSAKDKNTCNQGTILMARAVGMAEAVFKADRFMKVPGFVTLENPPPSDHPEHISAWHMPELVELVDRVAEWRCAHFNTCAYEIDVPLGERHYKPQMLGGTLQDIDSLSMQCNCGGRPHEPIVGKERSSRSASYPKAFCRAYGALVAKHFLNMAKAEFLEGRLKLLGDRINYLKGTTADLVRDTEDLESHTKHVETSASFERGMAHKRKGEEASPRSSSWDPSEGVDWSRSSSQELDVAEALPASSSAEKGSKRQRIELKTKKEVEEETEELKGKEPLVWKGGAGKHGTLREPRAKGEIPQALVYLGGMRDPHKAVVKLPTLQAQGQKLWERWRKFAVSHAGALEVAESYGTEGCNFDEGILVEWRKEICNLLDISLPGSRVTEGPDYTTPVFHEMLKAWVRRSGDPDKAVPMWLEHPPSDEADLEDDVRAHVVSDAVLERPDSWKNYKSVEEELDHAKAELQRYEDLRYLKRIGKETAEQDYQNGTISRLGLVLKTKESGEVKRRIVIDLRRSGGNLKSKLPEKLVLPRLVDAIKLMKEIRKRSTTASDPEGEDEVELALVDVQDAFTVLPVAKQEQKHALAPSTTPEELLVFQALLFGFKVAPLLYSRFAALVARMLQSAIKLNRGGHEVYLDDSLWVLQGTLAARTNTLAFVLNTMGALGIKVSLKKGSRASQATWIGVSLHLVDKDTLVVGLPMKFIEELQDILKKWESAGFAAIKELRVVCGKCAWLGGVLPRARWITTVFYAVLAQSLKEEEEPKGQNTRNRRGLFAVKRLELARQWMIAFLSAAKLRPMRRISLKTGANADIRITTDASPEALGGLLIINKRIVAAFFSEVDKKQADELLVEHKTSSSQSVLESLAILVALRRWAEKLKGTSVTITVQSDSITALALSQKLAAKSSSPGLNFLGAELALCLEELGVEEIKAVHVPGTANREADFLSRPSTWASASMPKALEGLDIASELGPGVSFYRLPTPKEAPSLWGVKAEAAGSVAAWDAVI